MLIKQTVEQFVQSLASDSPAPGGGSASALSGAMAAALLAMVCNLTLGRPKYAAVEGELTVILAQAAQAQQRLMALVDRDTEAFNQVMEAYRLPKESTADQAARTNAIQLAVREAAEVPLQVANLCLEVLKLLPALTDKGNSNAITDMGVAARLAETGVQGAVYNVLINLGSIKDEVYVRSTTATCEGLVWESQKTLELVHGAVKNKL
ncbi:MAG TPA: cyclodeaminase/cyclohydrolase family protein [Verrucomicrobiae bacterium]|nr:cyclodeaminase/cyclohydrolase family protein [Verrucomicrobiae bacterium]